MSKTAQRIKLAVPFEWFWLACSGWTASAVQNLGSSFLKHTNSWIGKHREQNSFNQTRKCEKTLDI
ncbi:MAG: hypothetical protein ACE5HO_05810 [bacterium]